MDLNKIQELLNEKQTIRYFLNDIHFPYSARGGLNQRLGEIDNEIVKIVEKRTVGKE